MIAKTILFALFASCSTAISLDSSLAVHEHAASHHKKKHHHKKANKAHEEEADEATEHDFVQLDSAKIPVNGQIHTHKQVQFMQQN